ncbi:MAG TPA: polysaccharide biosynthesis protein, partial [Saprospiraceae bacterium]|nr:polysaccharide biosynthesis protein [Saprospiraceae bacterium]
MRKKFSLNLLFLMGLNLLIKPLYIFGIDIKVQNTVGTAEYGLFFSIFSFTLIFQIILEWGLNNMVRRDIAESPSLAAKYLSQLLSFKLFLLP